MPCDIQEEKNKKKKRERNRECNQHNLISNVFVYERTTYLLNVCCYSFLCHLNLLEKYIITRRLLILMFDEQSAKRKNRNKQKKKKKKKKKEKKEKAQKKSGDEYVIMSSFLFLSVLFLGLCLYRTIVTLTDCSHCSQSYFDRFILSWEKRRSFAFLILLNDDFFFLLLLVLDSLSKTSKALYCQIR